MSLSTSVEVAAQPTVEKSGLRRPLPLILRRWLREPLLHFLLLGVVLFGVYGYTHRGRSGVEPSHQIPITLADLRSMDLYFESQWHRQPRYCTTCTKAGEIWGLNVVSPEYRTCIR